MNRKSSLVVDLAAFVAPRRKHVMTSATCNPYELAREARIAANKRKLSELEVLQTVGVVKDTCQQRSGEAARGRGRVVRVKRGPAIDRSKLSRTAKVEGCIRVKKQLKAEELTSELTQEPAPSQRPLMAAPVTTISHAWATYFR